jgi:hypothetical protein
MPMRRPPSPKPQQEPPNRAHDWATAATEARRQRDAAVKQELEERRLRRLQARAVANEWSSPQEKTRKV